MILEVSLRVPQWLILRFHIDNEYGLCTFIWTRKMLEAQESLAPELLKVFLVKQVFLIIHRVALLLSW